LGAGDSKCFSSSVFSYYFKINIFSYIIYFKTILIFLVLFLLYIYIYIYIYIFLSCTLKSMFEIVIAVAVQNVFRLKIHQNDVFLF
jgi:hypothetical protein